MSERRDLVTPTSEFSQRKQCELLSVHRSGLYYKPGVESQENLGLMKLLDKQYLDHPTDGVIRMQDFLLGVGFIVNHKRVRRLLRLMGILAIYPKRNLSKLGLAKYIKPYLLKGLKIDRPNHVWAIDITFIAMESGFMYLTAIIDHYSRYVVAWGTSNSLDAESSHRVLREAIKTCGKPEIINSDQGSQFTCKEWIDYLELNKIKISMDGKGRALDNIFIERLWRSVKIDYVYIRPASDGVELFVGLRKYFDYYNNKQRHQGIGRRIPADLYKYSA